MAGNSTDMEHLTAANDKFADEIRANVKACLIDTGEDVLLRTRQAMKTADQYANGNPRKATRIKACAGVIAGMLIAGG